MAQLHKFSRLPAPYRHLFIQALVLLAIVRLALWLLPFRTLQRLAAGMVRANPTGQTGDQPFLPPVAWAVTVASRYVPAATCLTQALATQALLARRGHSTSLRLGVARSEAGEFQAHAWVEWRGTIVIGGIEALSRFTPLPPLDGGRP
jgi:hypothetical protein